MQTFVDFFSNILQSDIDHTIYYLTEIRSPFYTLVFCRFLLKFIVNFMDDFYNEMKDILEPISKSSDSDLESSKSFSYFPNIYA